MPFKVRIDDETWFTEDLTLDELEIIEKDAGEPWSFVLTGPLKTAVTSKAILTRFLARRHGDTEGAKRAGALTFKQILDAFEYVEDDRPETHQDGIPVVDPKAGTVGTGTISSS